MKIGKLPLAQIAIESGFHDQPHFTHAFRKVVGTTPAKYSVGHNQPSDWASFYNRPPADRDSLGVGRTKPFSKSD
jgi:AraC-like DNA-binding protein